MRAVINNSFIILLTLFSLSCSGSESDKFIAPETLNKKSCFPNLVLDSLMLDAAFKEIEASGSAQTAYDKWISTIANNAMKAEVYSVAELTAENLNESKESAGNIYAISIAWLFMDKESSKADLYLQKAVTLILAWANINEPSSHTPNESIITPVYEAYSIIRPHIQDHERKLIDQWISKRADYYKKLSLTGNLLENNWNTIRINLLFYYAVILDDVLLYNNAVSKFKSHIELNILKDGVSHDFVNRDAFAYHAYNLLFYARILKAVGMYKGKDAAVALYTMKNQNGSSIQSCVNFLEPYLMDPATNVHLEFVNTQWAPDKNRSDYNKPYNPMGTVYVLDELRYIESKCSDYILKITSMNKYGRSFNYWINCVQP